MTLWRSNDGGGTWQKESLVDAGTSGYSSLQADCDNGVAVKTGNSHASREMNASSDAACAFVLLM